MKFVWSFVVLTLFIMCIVNSSADFVLLYNNGMKSPVTTGPSYEQKMRNYPELTYEYAQSYSRKNSYYETTSTSTMESLADVLIQTDEPIENTN